MSHETRAPDVSAGQRAWPSQTDGKLLQEALVELIEERGFDALTIGELTKP